MKVSSRSINAFGVKGGFCSKREDKAIVALPKCFYRGEVGQNLVMSAFSN